MLFSSRNTNWLKPRFDQRGDELAWLWDTRPCTGETKRRFFCCVGIPGRSLFSTETRTTLEPVGTTVDFMTGTHSYQCDGIILTRCVLPSNEILNLFVKQFLRLHPGPIINSNGKRAWNRQRYAREYHIVTVCIDAKVPLLCCDQILA